MRILLAILVAAFLSACAVPGPMRIIDVAGERRLSEADIVLVGLAEHDKKRVDRFVKSFFGEHKYGVETGSFWQQAFRGEASAPRLTIKSAELRESIDGGGFTIRYTYTAECELSHLGKTYAIRAAGSRAAAMATMSAMRQSVELGVADAAQQARKILGEISASEP